MTSTEERIEGGTIAEALAGLERQGYAGQFAVRAGARVLCLACRAEPEAQEVRLHHVLRVEGPSDPAGEAAIAALECPRCGAKGTVILTYGPMAPAEDGEVLLAFEDVRRRAAMPAGNA